MRLSELECKDVVDIKTGRKIGRVSDLEIDEKSMCVCFLVVSELTWKDLVLVLSKPRLKRVSVEQIVCIGKDVVLVKC